MDNKIYIKDWLELKPYDKQTATDSFYLKVCNDVKKAIITNKYSFLIQQYLSKKDINILSCFLTSYLEDVISGTNIWNSFVRMHLRMYQKHLPFYPLSNYYEEDINAEDVSFLVWYFINTVQRMAVIAPFNNYIIELSEKIIDIFNNVWEYAPENDHLKLFYKIDENEEDFYVARKLIDTLLFKTYLFYPDSSLKLQKLEDEIIENNEGDEKLLMYLNENRDSTLHTTYTQLLSLMGKDWVAEILGQEHGLHKDFLAISKRIAGFFFYKGQDDNNIFLEHIASGKKFNLTKKSFDHSEDLNKVDTILFMGIVRWKNEWWFSGIYFQLSYDAKLVSDEKNSLESRAAVNFLDHKERNDDKMIKDQLSAFKQLNNGRQIAFMPAHQIDKFLEKYTEIYNKSLNLSEKEIKETKQRTREDGFFRTTEIDKNYSEEEETSLVFFNEKSGCEVALGINSAFPLSWNPFYNEEDSMDHVSYLLIEEHFSAELTMYCIDNCKDKLSFFKKDIGKIYLKDIDFLLRFWKKDNYHTVPSITYIGGDS